VVYKHIFMSLILAKISENITRVNISCIFMFQLFSLGHRPNAETLIGAI
jgi:hypothetical protein